MLWLIFPEHFFIYSDSPSAVKYRHLDVMNSKKITIHSKVILICSLVDCNTRIVESFIIEELQRGKDLLQGIFDPHVGY